MPPRGKDRGLLLLGAPKIRTTIYLDCESSSAPPVVPNSSVGTLIQERQKRKELEGELASSNKALKQMAAESAAKETASSQLIEKLQAQLAEAKQVARKCEQEARTDPSTQAS